MPLWTPNVYLTWHTWPFSVGRVGGTAVNFPCVFLHFATQLLAPVMARPSAARCLAISARSIFNVKNTFFSGNRFLMSCYVIVLGAVARV